MAINAGKPAPNTAAPSSFRTVPTRQRSIWESFAVLPAQTRLKISLAITAVAVAGIFVSDYLENALPVPPTEVRGPADAVAKESPSS